MTHLKIDPMVILTPATSAQDAGRAISVSNTGKTITIGGRGLLSHGQIIAVNFSACRVEVKTVKAKHRHLYVRTGVVGTTGFATFKSHQIPDWPAHGRLHFPVEDNLVEDGLCLSLPPILPPATPVIRPSKAKPKLEIDTSIHRNWPSLPAGERVPAISPHVATSPAFVVKPNLMSVEASVISLNAAKAEYGDKLVFTIKDDGTIRAALEI